MNILIGLSASPREIALDIPLSEQELAQRLSEAVNQNTVLDLTDANGQRTLIPGRSIAYIHVSDQTERRVGFVI